MPDYKEIGLSAKDILMGVVTVVAGTQGGQAGAQGAQQLDRGLDSVLGMAGVKREAPSSRLNPEQADFAVRQQAIQKAAPRAMEPSAEPVFVPAVMEPTTTLTTAQTPQTPQTPVGVVAELARLGYSDAQIAQIAAGQYRPTSAGIVLQGAEPQPVVAQNGTSKQSAEPTKGSDYEGFNLNSVLGVLKSLNKS